MANHETVSEVLISDSEFAKRVPRTRQRLCGRRGRHGHGSTSPGRISRAPATGLVTRSTTLKQVAGIDRGMSTRMDRPHSTLILASRITLPHFAVSSANSLAKSAGEPGSGVPPSSVMRAFILGSEKAALSSRLSLSTIAVGVPTGAAIPYHALAS